MKFVLTEKEIIFLKEKFNFSKLIGLDENKKIDKDATLQSLKEKEAVYTFNNDIELSAGYRYLLTQWKNARYSLVRPDINDDKLFQCLLCGDKSILFVQRKEDVFEIELYDFNEQLIVECIKAVAQIQDYNQEVESFLLTTSVADLDELLDKTEEKLLDWQNRTGLSEKLILRYKEAISKNENCRLLLVEDHVGEVGFLAKIVVEDDGIFVLKHVTQKENEKMVMLKGNADYVTDSIFNF